MRGGCSISMQAIVFFHDCPVGSLSLAAGRLTAIMQQSTDAELQMATISPKR